MTSWGRGASGGMSQSMIGGVGGGASQDTRSNRYQILEDDSGTQHESGKAPFAGRSSLGGPPQSGRGSNQDYRTMPGTTKRAFFPPKDGDRGLDSLRSQNSGTFSIAIIKIWLLINSENDDKLDAVFNYDGLSSSTGLKPLTMSTENKTIFANLTHISFCDS